MNSTQVAHSYSLLKSLPLLQVYHDELEQSELRFSVYDLDQRRTRHSLGYVRVPLGDMDLSASLVLCKDLITTLTDHG